MVLCLIEFKIQQKFTLNYIKLLRDVRRRGRCAPTPPPPCLPAEHPIEISSALLPLAPISSFLLLCVVIVVRHRPVVVAAEVVVKIKI